MNINEILLGFRQSNTIGAETIKHIQTDGELRTALVNYFRQQHNWEFAIKLLDTFIEIRKQPNSDMPAEDLMLASYILGLHGHIEDCLKIWEAKYADFDTYCGFNTELLMFAGLNETISFLETQTTDNAQKALEYIREWFTPEPDHLTQYFSPQTLPWFI